MPYPRPWNRPNGRLRATLWGEIRDESLRGMGER